MKLLQNKKASQSSVPIALDRKSKTLHHFICLIALRFVINYFVVEISIRVQLNI